MTIHFSDYFWGEKNNGFDVLYHNMKYGLVASKELAEFLRERSNIEENNWKSVSKLAKQASGCCNQGSFSPLWLILKTTAERLAALHLQMVHKVGDLVKDVTKYAEELHKKHKSVKEEENGTLDVVQAIQSTSLTLQKAKDSCTQKGIELDKLKKETASPKELEKAELKLKKAQEEYKILIEKYSAVKDDFEKKMSLTCRHFQDVEELHLNQMKEFVNTYADLIKNNHDLVGQVHVDFRKQCLEMTADKLLEQFVLNKYTGLERPGSVELEPLGDLVTGDNESAEKNEVVQSHSNHGPVSGSSPAVVSAQNSSIGTNKREGNSGSWDKSKQSRRATSLLNLFLSNSHGKENITSCTTSAPTSPISSNISTIPRNPLRGSKWFLRSRRDKRKEKKAKKKKEIPSGETSVNNIEEKSDNSVPSEEKEEPRKSTTPTPEVDEEGYTIRPKIEMWENDKGSSFYSSSDTDSDDERERKIRVEIKPLSNGSGPMSASVDELRATVEALSLSPLSGSSCRQLTNSDCNPIKRSQSVSQQIGGKLNSNLVDLNTVQSPTGSSASTPTGNHPYAPLQSPTPPIMNQTSRYADLGDLFAEVGDIQPALPPKQRQIPTPTSGSIKSLPRPPSRRSEGGVKSPAPSIMSHGDSGEFRTSGILVGTSRGPSPLTIGMADTIPIAVAFHEIIHTYFRGTDESKCQVKLCGEMMLSFPAGILSVLANNPSPAKLSFWIKNISQLENILPNKQLICMDSCQSAKEGTIFEFNMSALISVLRYQCEHNASASYYNIDILKYQIKSKTGAESCPLHLVAYWKCEKNQTDLKIDYKYNSHSMSTPSPLLNLIVAVPVNGGVKTLQSKPPAQWVTESQKTIWKFSELSQQSAKSGVGSLRARLELSSGPSSLATISAQFNCEGSTLSGVDFQLAGQGYRVSLVKRRFVSGKYICDGDRDSKHKYYSTPPSSTC